MPRYHNINGTRVQFTEAEETARDNVEAAYANKAFTRAMEYLRSKRNNLLIETDYLALSDVSMSEEMTTYRQELRDLTNGLDTVEKIEAVEFPTKPSGE
jgi:TPP-dependent pyruvate/acetoin dehydrogenase alpha subunit